MKTLVKILAIATFITSCEDSVYVQENSSVALDVKSRSSLNESLYYYYQNEKTYLEVNTGAYYIVEKNDAQYMEPDYLMTYDEDYSEINTPSTTRSMVLSPKKSELQFTKKYLKNRSSSVDIYMDDLHNVIESGEASYVSPCLVNGNKEFYVSPEFYVKLKEEADTVLLKQQAELYSADIVEQNPFMPLWFTLSCRENYNLTSLEVMNRFHETGLFAATTPGFVGNVELCADDTYYSYQWGLENTGQYGGISGVDINAKSILALATGSGVIVGVVDSGIDYSHPDINNHYRSYDAYNGVEYSSSAVVYNSSAHGTACAGIIASNVNAVGIKGIAPSSQVIAVSAPFPASNAPLANGILWAANNGASVISCSWGSLTLSDLIKDAVNEAANNGRNGKGCVLVFATGNDDNSSINYPATLDNVIAVGAIDMAGKRQTTGSISTEPWGSNYGEGIDVVAPGILIATTDITGTLGYNTNWGYQGTLITSDFSDDDYTSYFNGTSAATPFVAGVAALIIERMPDLTQAEVRSIIQKTCTKLPDYTFSTNSSYPDGTWNQEVGYGLLNAYDAVANALVYSLNLSITGNNIVTTSGENIFMVSNIPSGTGVTWRISSSNFTLTTLSYNVVMVTPKVAGETAILYADIVSGSNVVGTLVKTIQSQ